MPGARFLCYLNVICFIKPSYRNKIMPQPSRQQILRLYKHLIRYGNQLQLTDKSYFLRRIRTEFRENITTSKEVEFNFKKGEALLRNGRIL